MLIFWKERLVFLANTKTGSTSVERALEPLAHVSVQRPPALKHLSARQYHATLAPFLESQTGQRFTTVALVREPVDWLGSWYRYRQRDDIPYAPGSTDGTDFAGFTDAYLAGQVPGIVGDGGPAAGPLGAQADFLCDASGACLVDRVFRYENITDFLHFLDDRLGCEVILPRLNVSPKATMHLPDDLRARLMDRFAIDYAVYRSVSGGEGA
jgi:hypothetical protein